MTPEGRETIRGTEHSQVFAVVLLSRGFLPTTMPPAPRRLIAFDSDPCDVDVAAAVAPPDGTPSPCSRVHRPPSARPLLSLLHLGSTSRSRRDLARLTRDRGDRSLTASAGAAVFPAPKGRTQARLLCTQHVGIALPSTINAQCPAQT